MCAIDLALSDPSSTSETSLEIATTSDHTGCDSIPDRSVLRTLQSDCCSHDQTSIARRSALFSGLESCDNQSTALTTMEPQVDRSHFPFSCGSLPCLEHTGGPLTTVDLDRSRTWEEVLRNRSSAVPDEECPNTEHMEVPMVTLSPVQPSTRHPFLQGRKCPFVLTTIDCDTKEDSVWISVCCLHTESACAGLTLSPPQLTARVIELNNAELAQSHANTKDKTAQ